MQSEDKQRVAVGALVICILYIWFVHVPSRIDYLRDEVQRRVSALERRPIPGHDHGPELREAYAALERKLKELESRLGAQPTESTRSDLVGLKELVRELDSRTTRLAAELNLERSRLQGDAHSSSSDKSGSILSTEAEFHPPMVFQAPLAMAESLDTSPGLPIAETVVMFDWKFDVLGSRMRGERVFVVMNLTSLSGDKMLQLSPIASKCFDQTGRQLQAVSLTFAGERRKVHGDRPMNRLFLSGLATEVLIEFSGATAETHEVAGVDVVIAEDAEAISVDWSTVTLRKVPTIP